MIIDSHTHIGRINDFELSDKLLLSYMDNYAVDQALVSSIEGAEFDSGMPLSSQQIDVNKKLGSIIRKYPERLKGLFWIKPHLEGFHEDVETYLAENRDVFKGLKAHPFLSRLPVTDKAYGPYFDCARRLNMPVAVHTAADDFSLPRYCAEAAENNPKVNFIMVHMGLDTDNSKAIELLSSHDNLYGDTSWVEPSRVLLAIKRCGSSKILFGTDAPLAGKQTGNWYCPLFELLQKELNEEERMNILFKNAIRLFEM